MYTCSEFWLKFYLCSLSLFLFPFLTLSSLLSSFPIPSDPSEPTVHILPGGGGVTMTVEPSRMSHRSSRVAPIDDIGMQLLYSSIHVQL